MRHRWTQRSAVLLAILSISDLAQGGTVGARAQHRAESHEAPHLKPAVQLPFKSLSVIYRVTGQTTPEEPYRVGWSAWYIDVLGGKERYEVWSDRTSDPFRGQKFVIIWDGSRSFELEPSGRATYSDKKRAPQLPILASIYMPEGSSVVGEGVILGKVCGIYEGQWLGREDRWVEKDKIRTWVWNGLIMKQDFLKPNGGYTFWKVVSLELDSPIGEEKFTLPKGVKPFHFEPEWAA